MKQLKRSVCLILAVLMALSLVGCGGGDPEPVEAEAEAAGVDTVNNDSGGEQAGGTIPGSELNLHMSADPGNFAPLGSGGNQGFELAWNIFEGLVEAENGDYSRIVPCLAEEYSISEDGLTYTFKLRQNVVFQNGDPFTAEDVLCTFKTLSEDANASGTFGVIESYEAPDDYTVVCHLSSPSANLLAQFAHPSWGIINHRLYEEYGYTEDVICGTGPYYLESYTVSSEVVLKAFQDYWGEPAIIETLNFKIITDNNTAYMAFLAGDLDTLWGASALQVTQNQDNPDVAVVAYGGLGNLDLFLNASVEPFDDIRVREAFSYLIDREQVALAGFGELGIACTDYFSGAIEGALSEEQYTVYEYDVDKGLALLAEAGYEPADISFTLMTSNAVSGYQESAENIQSQLLALGMNVEVVCYEWPTFRSNGMSNSYDAFVFSGNATCADPIQTYQVMFVSTAGWNAGHIEACDPDAQAEIDALVEQASVTVDKEARIALLEEANMKLHEVINGIPLATCNNYYLYRSDLAGYGICPDDGQCKWATAYFVE